MQKKGSAAQLLNKENVRAHSKSCQRRLRYNRVKSQSLIDSIDRRIVLIQNFLDDSLVEDLHVQSAPVQLPTLEEMPSVDLASVNSSVLSPRDFDEFTRGVRLTSDKLQKIFDRRKYIQPTILFPFRLPARNWTEYRNKVTTQAIRPNITNNEYKKVLAEGKKVIQTFQDDMFRSNNNSFVASSPSKNISATRVSMTANHWKKLWFYEGDPLPFETIIQGTYNTENLLSCFVSLPLWFQMNLFEEQVFEGKAIFFVRLNKDGIWRYIVIDNVVPYAEDDICMLSGGFCITLLEKAWAKYEGSYASLDYLQKIKLTDLMTDLTGCPSEEFRCSHPKLLYLLGIMQKRKYVMLANNEQSQLKKKKLSTRLGIPSQYSYPIVKVDTDSVVLRNDWGYEETSAFNGVRDIRLHISQFKQYFDSVVVCKTIRQGYQDSLAIRHKKNSYSLVGLVPSSSTTLLMTLCQIHIIHADEQYSPCRIVLFQQDREMYWLVQEEDTLNDKKINMQLELQENTEYLLLIQFSWQGTQHDSVLSTVSEHQVQLIKTKACQQYDYLVSHRHRKTSSRM